jgi:disulfide bond formation protein DsbB
MGGESGRSSGRRVCAARIFVTCSEALTFNLRLRVGDRGAWIQPEERSLQRRFGKEFTLSPWRPTVAIVLSLKPTWARAFQTNIGADERPERANGSRRRANGGPSMNSGTRAADSSWNLVFACWVIASVSTLGALFFSEVMQLPPCVLCWYQRIFMFPLVLMLPAALFPFDARIVRYALPLSLIGGLIAFFHVLLVAGVIPEDIKPCTQGVPCSETQIEWFGFLTIPLLSLLAFSSIIALLIRTHIRTSK